jgi:hypothetical protein
MFRLFDPAPVRHQLARIARFRARSRPSPTARSSPSLFAGPRSAVVPAERLDRQSERFVHAEVPVDSFRFLRDGDSNEATSRFGNRAYAAFGNVPGTALQHVAVNVDQGEFVFHAY